MWKCLLMAGALAGVEALASGALAQAPAGPWAQVARTDIDFIHRTIRDNHPGPVDPDNAWFREWMKRGYVAARAEADRADSLAAVTRMLSTYVAGFADGHLGLGLTYQSRTVRWPGLIVARQLSKYVVAFRDERAALQRIPVGAQLLSCDGRTIDVILREDILPSVFNNGELDAVKVRHAPKVLLIDEPALHREYKSCAIAGPGGAQEITLEWERIDRATYARHLATALSGAAGEITLEQLAPRQHWVRLPNFHPSGQQEAALKAIIRKLPELRASELVVFDVRGNGGGNSQWGQDLVTALYGSGYVGAAARDRPDHSYAEWRVSADNARYLDELSPELRKRFGADSAAYRSFSELAIRMHAAQARGEALVRQGDDVAADEAAGGGSVPKDSEPLTHARVVLLTDASCGSACLDFADLLLPLRNVVHMGQPTGADTVYMDLRSVPLPSGLGTLSFAQKVYRGRLRAHNQAYVPGVLFDGPIGDTGQVQPWVLRHAPAGAARP